MVLIKIKLKYFIKNYKDIKQLEKNSISNNFYFRLYSYLV